MVDDTIHEGAETLGVAKRAGFDGVEDIAERGVELEAAAVEMIMTEVIDILGEIAELVKE